jgi:hypothetical protein
LDILVKAKKNDPLVDSYYVRPHKNVESGRKGVEYFGNDDEVLEYCNRHDDYPVSSPESTKKAPSAAAAEEQELLCNNNYLIANQTLCHNLATY